MERRQMLAGLAASALMNAEIPGQRTPSYLELKTWRLHNSAENQGQRVAEYLEHGLAPALSRAGARLDGAFSNVVGPESPSYTTLTQFASLNAMQDVLVKLSGDEEHRHMLEKLGAGTGLPFVRVESSLLRSFDGMPEPATSGSAGGAARIFELRTYESQSFLTLARKVRMFNTGEMQIFQRLGFRPVFFGETIVGSRQPNLTYMLSYDDLAMRDRLWKAFVSDPEWKKLSSRPELKDAEIVANISNAILAPLKFSPIH